MTDVRIWIVFTLAVGTVTNANNFRMRYLYRVSDEESGECRGALGLESGVITDGQITASSEAGAKLAPSNARLRLKKQKTPRKRDGGWSAKKGDVNQWLQIDLFDENAKVTGVATQGREDNNQWVLEYKLQFSDDGVDFQDYVEPGQTEGKVFTGNTDRSTVVRHDLSQPITARFVRFRPLIWKGAISMRAELYGCLAQTCANPLGMESGEISDAQLSASSKVGTNHGPQRGRLNIWRQWSSRGAWSAETDDVNQWFQVDLLSQYTKVTAIATQGSEDMKEWVTKYKLHHSQDGVNFDSYKEPREAIDKDFAGNKDQNTIVYHKLKKPIIARFIRFVPMAWFGHISMRVELYGCSALLENLDENGDGFASQSEIVNFGLVWQGDVDYFDLNYDGKLNLEETKILMSKDLEKKKMICHFKATDTNHDLFVTVEELKTRFEHLKYDITQDGVVEFIQQGDDDVADNKFNYNEFKKAMFNA